MSVSSVRKVTNSFTGDLTLEQVASAENNSAAPGAIGIVTLVAGANTITPPEGAIGVTIIPPADNATLIILKGVTGDTGVALHNTDPTSLGLNTDEDTFVLTAAAEIVGLRLIWS